MTLIEKIISSLLFGIFIYFWNTYVVVKVVKSVTRMNNNKPSLVRNEKLITKGSQGFFWIAFGMYLLSMILSE